MGGQRPIQTFSLQIKLGGGGGGEGRSQKNFFSALWASLWTRNNRNKEWRASGRPEPLPSIRHCLDPCKGIRIPKSEKISTHRIRNSGKFCSLNLESWALEYRIQLKGSGILLTIGIQNPSFTGIRNPESGIRNPESVECDPESKAVLDSLHGTTCH